MKHAGAGALDALEPVLAQLRTIEGLKEKNRGTFYRGSKAFLHFHEDPAGLFADLKKDGDFVRFSINNRSEIAALLREAKRAVAEVRESSRPEDWISQFDLLGALREAP